LFRSGFSALRNALSGEIISPSAKGTCIDAVVGDVGGNGARTDAGVGGVVCEGIG